MANNNEFLGREGLQVLLNQVNDNSAAIKDIVELVAIQPDWNETNEASLAYIKNKTHATIPITDQLQRFENDFYGNWHKVASLDCYALQISDLDAYYVNDQSASNVKIDTPNTPYVCLLFRDHEVEFTIGSSARFRIEPREDGYYLSYQVYGQASYTTVPVTIEQLSPAYIPIDNYTLALNEWGGIGISEELLSAMGQAFQGDWNNEDPYSPAHILNKPPVKKGAGDKSLVIGTGEATAVAAIAGGTTDSTLIESMVGSTAASAIKPTAAKATAPMSAAYGASVETISPGSMTIGYGSATGVKGYYWESLTKNSDGTATINLAKTQQYDSIFVSNSGLKSSFEKYLLRASDIALANFPWKVGDTVSIVADKRFPFCAKITKVETKSVTVTRKPLATYTATIDNVYVITIDKAPCDSIQFEPGLAEFLGAMIPDHYSIYAVYENANWESDKTSRRWHARDGMHTFGYAAANLGIYNLVTGSAATARGYNNAAIGEFASVEGNANVAGGRTSHVEGSKNITAAEDSHVEGWSNEITRDGANAHVEGKKNKVMGNAAHAGGANTMARGVQSFAHGSGDNPVEEAIAKYNELKGTNYDAATIKDGEARAVQTYTYPDPEDPSKTKTTAFVMSKGSATTALGINTLSTTGGSLATGQLTYAAGAASLATGYNTQAIGAQSFAGGRNSIAKNENAFAFGQEVTTGRNNQFVVGQWNESDTESVFVVGDGDSTNDEFPRRTVMAVGRNKFKVDSNYGDAGFVLSGNDLHLYNKAFNLSAQDAGKDSLTFAGVQISGTNGDSSSCSFTFKDSPVITEATLATKNYATKSDLNFKAFTINGGYVSGNNGSFASSADGKKVAALSYGSFAIGQGSNDYNNVYVANTNDTQKIELWKQTPVHMAMSGTTAVIGQDNMAMSRCAVAVGHKTIAQNRHSFSAGFDNKAFAINGVALGEGLQVATAASNTSASGQVVVGRYNEALNDAVFVVGAGTGPSDTEGGTINTPISKKNAVVVKRDGTVLINGVDVIARIAALEKIVLTLDAPEIEVVVEKEEEPETPDTPLPPPQYYIHFNDESTEFVEKEGLTVKFDGVVTSLEYGKDYYCHECCIYGDSVYMMNISGNCIVDANDSWNDGDCYEGFTDATITLNGNVHISNLEYK